MSRVVIVGAFDRYNYGDNLMPVLFEMFVSKYYPSVFLNHEFVYSALTDSDLSKYKAKKTIAMHKVLGGLNEKPHSIISIGGEVLCASSSNLFLHMNNTKLLTNIILFLRKFRMTMLADLFCRFFYKLPWEYPYIPKKSLGTLVAFNTVGGGVPRLRLGLLLNTVKKRLADADYLSVRDKRTYNSINKFSSPKVFPDSAIVMAEFITDDFLIRECSDKVNHLRNESYICFQAAPKKSGASAIECANVLNELSVRYGFKVVLCPIGYASGHDDVDFLKEVQKESQGNFELVYDLNIWEIMSVIKNSKIFLGTSLHGVITALSFTVPYIGINPKVTKLDMFLKDWGVCPSDRSYSISEVLGIVDTVIKIDKEYFCKHSKELRRLGLENNHSLVNALNLNK